ncbi:MAG: ABC-F family ATP-binding cassette domain-containing protein [Chloroflexota bacterium]|nr:ABC-F family ATP-binding cassette domain-containing protein [Chloroflexota bacterium]
MNLITLENIRHQYSERLLLDNINLLINRGDRIGLIGVNGSGKTTLLRIIAGLESPDRGTVTAWGGVRIRYLPQEPRLDDNLGILESLFQSDAPRMRLLRDFQAMNLALEERPEDPELHRRLLAVNAEMDRSDGWKAEADAKAILTRLGVGSFSSQIGTLSGGQHKRVALARALLDPGDLLILDEPTNHIDADTIDWLEQHLLSLNSALLMVTHDRYFLDRIVNRIVELDRRQLISYPGNYTRYLEQREARHRRLAESEENRRRLLRQELAWLHRSPMARSGKQKARKQRLDELQKIHHDGGQGRVSMILASRRLGKKVLSARGLKKSYGDHTVINGLDFELEPGDRIGIIGPNGAGKSTFLDILAGTRKPDSGELDWGKTVQLGYYDQRNLDLDESMRVIDFVQEQASLILTDNGQRVEAAQMLEWFLFPRPQQWARIAALSGGERRRLYLLRTLIHQPNVLLLDEPSNDLDIQTLTVLEEFLDHFKGCLIVASHDRYFLDRTVDYLVNFEAGGRVSGRYPTPFSLYRQMREENIRQTQERAHGRASGSVSTTRDARAHTGAPRPQKLSWKEERELEALEVSIEEMEGEKETLQSQINASGDDYARLQTLAERLQEIDAKLDRAMERWLELSELTA